MFENIEKLRKRLEDGGVVLLDGATGTELERRGAPTPAPLWSAEALRTHAGMVRTIHREYREAGAEILVANTFRTNVRALQAGGRLEQGAELVRLAVELAREAGGAEAVVAGSAAPVEDCYSPQLGIDEQTFYHEHAVLMEWFKLAGVDLVWIETMNHATEARAAAKAAARAGLPFVCSFALEESGRLLSNELLEKGVEGVAEFEPLAFGLNCIPPRGITEHLPRLRRLTDAPLAAYAHINNDLPIPGWSYAERIEEEEYAEYVRRWVDLGASIVGGCCGTTPGHIRALREAIDNQR